MLKYMHNIYKYTYLLNIVLIRKSKTDFKQICFHSRFSSLKNYFQSLGTREYTCHLIDYYLFYLNTSLTNAINIITQHISKEGLLLDFSCIIAICSGMKPCFTRSLIIENFHSGQEICCERLYLFIYLF